MERHVSETPLREAIEGDQFAVQKLLLGHYDELRDHVARKIPPNLKRLSSVDDVVQESLSRAVESLPTCKAQTTNVFLAWLKAISDRVMQDILRRQGRKKRGGDQHQIDLTPQNHSSVVDLAQSLVDRKGSPPSSLARHEIVQAIQVGIAGLSKAQQTAIRRNVLAGEPLDKVAETLEKTPTAVRGLVHRAKQKLRESLGRSTRWFDKK